MSITLRELETRIVKLIEEHTQSGITDDEDIKAKLPVLINQGIEKIVQAKPILKMKVLEFGDSTLFGNYRLYKIPEDMYQLRQVDIGDEQYWQEANGEENYVMTREGFVGDILIKYSAFHPEILSNAHLDETEIELSRDCLTILVMYVCAGLTMDSPEMYGHFYGEYQSGMQNLKESRSDKLIELS